MRLSRVIWDAHACRMTDSRLGQCRYFINTLHALKMLRQLRRPAWTQQKEMQSEETVSRHYIASQVPAMGRWMGSIAGHDLGLQLPCLAGGRLAWYSLAISTLHNESNQICVGVLQIRNLALYVSKKLRAGWWGTGSWECSLRHDVVHGCSRAATVRVPLWSIIQQS